MMTSIAIGMILGIIIPSKDLTLPTIISVLIGMVVGYLTGRPISLLVALDGFSAGIMGGMMGAMLGVMLQPKSAEIMVYFIDFLFVLINVLQIRVIDEEIKTFSKKPLFVNLIIIVILLIFLVSIVMSSIDLIKKH
ncbi:hypothetical protein [Bacillus sp. EB600]|uniref:hypothetical protein n=1 Tax=Bacillus sp. EB600 TaxID=2806345 RepID=UPI00210D291B|nr:hypothetical protein [Bacillus sp. EB600]MCQ6280780.1 hypothetical protein [Bacillus sp. EB600]